MSKPETGEPVIPSPCPFCGLGGGFHDDDVHARTRTPVPAGKLLPTSAADRRVRTSVCRSCGAGWGKPPVPPCQNPRHARQLADGEDWVAAGREFLAELEREFGPVPDDVRAEVRRKWRR